MLDPQNWTLICDTRIDQTVACCAGIKERVIASPHPDRGSEYASTRNLYSSYKLIRVFGVPTPPVSVYCSGLFVNKIKTQKRVIGRIVNCRCSCYYLGPFSGMLGLILRNRWRLAG